MLLTLHGVILGLRHDIVAPPEVPAQVLPVLHQVDQGPASLRLLLKCSCVSCRHSDIGHWSVIHNNTLTLTSIIMPICDP